MNLFWNAEIEIDYFENNGSYFRCEQCDSNFTLEITLTKYTNTQHSAYYKHLGYGKINYFSIVTHYYAPPTMQPNWTIFRLNPWY